MKRAVFVLGTPERRSVGRGEMLTTWTFDQLNRLAEAFDLDASIVFAVTDQYMASRSKTEIGIDRIRAERGRCLDEISGANPDIVFLFGGVAAASVMDHGSMTEDQLQRRALFPFATPPQLPDVDPGDPGVPCYFTHSIEQARMAPGMEEWWHLDVAAALRGHSGTKVEPWSLNDQTGCVPVGGLVGFDLETTGLDPWAPNAAIRMVQMSVRDEDGAMVTRVWDWDKVPQGVFTILSDPDWCKVGANIAFDVRWCRRFGVEVNNYRDVLVLEHVINPGNPRLTLKDLAFKYFPQVGNYQRAVYDLARKYNDDWSLIPAVDMYEYAAADAQVSLVTAETQLAALTGSDDRALESAGQLLADLYPLLTTMTANGVCVDEYRNFALDELYAVKIAQLRRDITLALGPVNPNAPDQLAKALKKAIPDLDLTPWKIKRVLDEPKTFNKGSSTGFPEDESDEVSTDRLTLEREAEKHPVIKTILEYRKFKTRHGTFVQGVREKHLVRHGGQAFIHPDFRSDVTDTYRLSSRNPNGQNMPRNIKKDEANLSVKRQFVSRFPGGQILEADMSQIELRVAAWFSGDEAMLAAVAGGDVHQQIAAKFKGKAPQDVTEEERQECKTLGFLILYGGGAKKLAEALKVPVPRASQLIDQYFEAYPGLREAIDNVHLQVRNDLHVRTPFGFRRRFIRPDNWRSADGFGVQRQAWNTIIQNTAACLMYCAMIRFEELLKELARTHNGIASVPVLQIHDSLVVDVPPNEKHAVARLLQQAMREAPIVAARYGVTFDVPIESEVKAGPSWGEVIKLEGEQK